MTRIFPDQVPAQTFEFPSLTVCPDAEGAIINIIQCYVESSTGSTISCDPSGIYVQNTTFDGVNQTCSIINDNPGVIMAATNVADVLYIQAQLQNVTTGSAAGILVNAHPAGVTTMDFDSYFAASAFTFTEVILK